MKAKDNQALKYWDDYKKQVSQSTFIDVSETAEEQRKRMEKLEKDPEKWFKYYFPKFAFAEPAQFHKDATKRVLNNRRWYEVRAWSRELAKSTRTMMEVLYMVLTKMRFNVLLISNSKDNAVRLIKPYKINFESNGRIINDYGKQESFGDWTEDEFITKQGVAFRAIGAGQSPRGSRAEEKRIDVVLIDDIDTDEDCRNETQVKQRWEWIEQAVVPTVSVSGDYTFIFCGNIIAKYCCITEAIKKAMHVDVINIRDNDGNSSWPQKNTEQDINDLLSLISYISQQKEFYNNPITKGDVFSEMHYKNLQPLTHYKYLVCYIDLSYKATKKNDYKFAVLMGKFKEEYHLHKCWGKQGTTQELAKGLIDIKNYVGNKTALYFYAEENFIQDIILKELHNDITALGSTISISPDTRKKPDKFHRIESTLEPLNTNGKFFLNEAERDNPHMQTLDEQFTSLSPGGKSHDDGPDAAEGAKHIIDSKNYDGSGMTLGARKVNPKRY